MKSKKIFVIILALMFILRLEIAFPYENNLETQVNNMLCKEDYINCNHYKRMRFELDRNDFQKKYIYGLEEILLKYDIKINHIKDDMIKDNYTINSCNLYIKNKDSKCIVVLDLYLDKDNDINFSSKVIKEIESLFRIKIDDYSIYNNLKYKLNDNVNIDDLKNKLENYLDDMGYEFSSIKLRNGYSIEILLKGNKDAKLYLALNRYSSGSYIVAGNPEIFISY